MHTSPSPLPLQPTAFYLKNNWCKQMWIWNKMMWFFEVISGNYKSFWNEKSLQSQSAIARRSPGSCAVSAYLLTGARRCNNALIDQV